MPYDAICHVLLLIQDCGYLILRPDFFCCVLCSFTMTVSFPDLSTDNISVLEMLLIAFSLSDIR